MYLFVCVVWVSLVTCLGQDLTNGSPCLTPNGENAKCIPIESCSVIKKALAYLNQEAIEFAKSSQCGYDDDGPLVCCGTVGRVTTVAPPVEKTTPKQDIILSFPPATPIDNQLLPDLTLCGLQLSNSSYGEPMTKEEHPWLASLNYVKTGDTLEEHKCSGALINQRYIVTAAECVHIEGYTLKSAKLGFWSLSSNKNNIRRLNAFGKPVEPKEIRIEETTIHPYYNSKRGSNNIALLRLAEKVEYNDIIRAICLPPNDFPAPIPGTGMEISSWSTKGTSSDVKEKGYISLMRYEDCERLIANYTKLYYPSRVCVNTTHHVRLCNGESGVPLVKLYEHQDETVEDLESQLYIEGIVNKRFGCNGPDVYMRISRFVTWIINNMNV